MFLLIVFAVNIAFAAGCRKAAQETTAAPELSASDKAKMAKASRQAQIDFESAQINHSNLPPEQKQRLLEQVRASAGK
jgi:hypothetical protein